MERKYRWYKIADDETGIPFRANGIAVVEANGKTISMARHAGGLFAFSHKCPHASGILAEGWVDPRGNIVCPVHGYRFDVKNGRNTTGEGYRLRHWPVERRVEGVFVEMEEE